MKRVLVINTASFGYTGISSVLLNYVKLSYLDVKYYFVLAGKIEQNMLKELQKYAQDIFIPPFERTKEPIKYMLWLTVLLKKEAIDVAHVHGNSGTMYFDIHAAKIAKIPIRIAHSHSTSTKYMLVHKILKPFLNYEMTKGIACSDIAGRWLFNKEFEILSNGIDIDSFKFSNIIRMKYRKELGLENKFVIGHVGYMDIEKNHMYLLKMFKEFLIYKPDAVLILIGDGRLRVDIEHFIQINNLRESVVLLGKRGDVNCLYQCMDVFVLPSIFEGLPVSLVEAQTAGLSCLVSDTVTKEVNFTNKITYIGIDDLNIKDWINELKNIEYDQCQRMDAVKKIKNTSFDIKSCKEKLMKIYYEY